LRHDERTEPDGRRLILTGALPRAATSASGHRVAREEQARLARRTRPPRGAAATFQGERLWAAAHVSSATSTRLPAVRDKRTRFGDPITVNSWPIAGDRICAPHPPDCQDGQTFIGDYTGLVATRRRVVAAYIEPPAGPPQPNRVLVSSFR
jgi:hypothetical protein